MQKEFVLARKPGILRLLKDEIDAQVVPALEDIGFVPDPGRQQDAGWDGQAYSWYFLARPDPGFIIQLWIWTGVSRDPSVRCNWQGFLTDTHGMDDARAARHLYRQLETSSDYTPAGKPAVRPVNLSPYRRWTAIGLGLLDCVDLLPRHKHLRLVMLSILFVPALAFSAVFIPLNFVAMYLDAKWLKSDAARSGRRQKAVAHFMAQKIKNLPARQDQLRVKAKALP